MKEIFISLEKSIKRFEEILQAERTVANRDSAIKRFEFTSELAWKCVQKFLRNQEILCRSPKECFKEAFKFGLIEDNPGWIEMLEDRNLTVHAYDEKIADNVYNRLPKYLELFDSLKQSLKKQMEE